MALPGLPGFSLPPLQLGGSASAGGNQNGSAWSMGTGDWNVNLGGSGGPAFQSPALSLPVLLMVAAAAYLLWKR